MGVMRMTPHSLVRVLPSAVGPSCKTVFECEQRGSAAAGMSRMFRKRFLCSMRKVKDQIGLYIRAVRSRSSLFVYVRVFDSIKLTATTLGTDCADV